MFHKSGTASCALMSTQPLADAQHHERHQKYRQQCSSVTHCARAYVSEPHHESALTQPQTGRSPQAPRQRAHVVRDAIQDHELDRPRQCASLLVVGQVNDLTAVDTEDHFLPTRQIIFCPPGNVTTNFNSSPGGCTSLIIISLLISAISPLRSPPKKSKPIA